MKDFLPYEFFFGGGGELIFRILQYIKKGYRSELLKIYWDFNFFIVVFRAGLGSMVSEDVRIPNRFVGLSE